MGVYAVVRLRGHRRVRGDIEDALRSLRLTRTNHCVLVPATPEVEGQLQKAKDYITFGTVDAKRIADLIRTRGRLEGDHPVTDQVVSKTGKWTSIDDFAQAIARGDARYGDLPHVTPLFRLHPPTKGFRSLKRSVRAHGDLGARGPAIEDLLARMV